MRVLLCGGFDAKVDPVSTNSRCTDSLSIFCCRYTICCRLTSHFSLKDTFFALDLAYSLTMSSRPSALETFPW
jgi:hypothetical protein